MSNVSNIKLFIRMDAEFIRNILPHVNVSIAGKGHYIYACISPKCSKLQEVAQWLNAQDSAAITESYLNDDGWTFSDEKVAGKDLKYIVVGMSLSQLNYSQLVALDDENCHHVIMLPSDRTIPEMIPTKNPLIYRNAKNPDYLFFVRNRAMDQVIDITR